MRFLAAALLACAVSAPLAAPAFAADVAPRPGITSEQSIAEARHYVSQRAVLFMIRATFGVIPTDDIATLVAGDVKRVAAAGPTEVETAALQRELLSEASYFLVSLQYLAESGGANWPGDRPESTYVNDARVKIAGLIDQLITAVQSGGDALPIMQEADDIYALTEGMPEAIGVLDHFTGRDEIVDAAYEQVGPRSST